MRFLFMLLFLLATPAYAQWQPACPEILKLEPEKFIQTYRERNAKPDFEIAVVYSGCQLSANNKKLERNPKLKARIATLRRLEYAFLESEATFFLLNGGMSGITSGAGSGLTDLQNRVSIYVEQHLSKVIVLALSKDGALVNASIKTRHATAKAQLEAKIKKMLLGATKNIDPAYLPDVKSSNPNYAKDWAQAAQKYQSAYSSIFTLVGSPINITSTTMLEFLNSNYYGI